MRPEDLLARLEAGYAYDPMYGQLCNERDQLKAENAKLREFSARLYKHICITEGHMRGSGYDSFDYYDERARELGIEVDDERPNL